MLRIVGGVYGNRKIRAPAGLTTRPTAQSVREALFNILAQEIQNHVFVDLFAGSGAVGVEALSRGAGKTLFVEKDRKCCGVIRENLKQLRVSESDAYVLEAEIGNAPPSMRKVCSGLIKLGACAAGIVFADPPYNFIGMRNLPHIVSESGICENGGLLVVEHGVKTEMPGQNGGYAKFREIRYGDASLAFYRILL